LRIEVAPYLWLNGFDEPVHRAGKNVTAKTVSQLEAKSKKTRRLREPELMPVDGCGRGVGQAGNLVKKRLRLLKKQGNVWVVQASNLRRAPAGCRSHPTEVVMAQESNSWAIHRFCTFERN
jgi:hypothetical protein